MINEALIFRIAHLLEKETGISEKYTFEGPVEFEGIKTKSEIKGKAKIMRIDDGVNIALEDVSVKINLPCAKCLKRFTYEVKVDFTERQYYLEKPEIVEDINDLYLIDKKNMEIDLTEPLRQEIILHFPVVQVCSTRCKGLCPHCGKDKNKEKCDCKEIEVDENEAKPLAKLKSLLK